MKEYKILISQVRRLKLDVDKLAQTARQAAGGRTDDNALEWNDRARTLTEVRRKLDAMTKDLEQLVGTSLQDRAWHHPVPDRA